jgi:hypothetical protein
MSKESPARGLAKKAESALESFIFASRWVQAPIYVALILAAVAYAWKSVQELIHLMHDFNGVPESTIMLGILSLVDISMVANLVNMVVVGGYVTFVSRIDFEDNTDRPDWLDHINANTLKVKHLRDPPPQELHRHHRADQRAVPDVRQPGEGHFLAGDHPRRVPRLDDPFRLQRADAAARGPLIRLAGAGEGAQPLESTGMRIP